MVWRMQTNDSSVAPVADADHARSVDSVAEIEPTSGRSRRRREREGLTEMLRPRFTPGERGEVDTAAASAGMSTSRFCAEAALAAARGTPMVLSVAQDREALVRLQRQLFMAVGEVKRFGTNVNQAVAALNATGEAPEWMGRAMTRVGYSINALDEVIAEVDRRIR
jgi:uncharacterized protein (DUF1778 family)